MTTPNLPRGTHLQYRVQQLTMEEVDLKQLASTHGTPLFVYSKAAMLDALAAY